MNEFTFTTFLTSNLDINTPEIETIIKGCTVKHVAKDDYILKQGDFCTHTFFVEKGLLKQYSIDEKGREHILQFAPENWFIGDRESLYFNSPSEYFIQALEDSILVMVDEQLVSLLSHKFPSFTHFNNQLLHSHIHLLQKRVNQLLSATAEERYLDFVKTYPDLLLRIPQTMVASYLGITPESLSRVRRSLVKKNV